MTDTQVPRPRILRTLGVSFFVLGVIGWWLYAHVTEPLPIFVQSDPEFAYLMSSLSVFKGHPYTFYHHPGTPVEMIGSGLMLLTYPFVGGPPGSFVMHHILHPQLFITMVHGILTLGSIGTLVLLALRALPIKHWTDELAAVAVSVLYFVIHPLAFDSIVYWSHNSFSFPVGALLALYLLTTLRPMNPLTRRQLSLLGFSLGVLAAVQFYFVTWIAGAIVGVSAFLLIQRQGWRQVTLASLNVGATSLAGFVIATLPILKRLPEFIAWILDVTTHQGRHSTGPPGFLSLQLAVSNFVGLWKELRLMFIAIVFVFALLGIVLAIHRGSIKREAGLWAAALGLTVQLTLMTTLVIKHPAVKYMQAVAATLPLLLAIAFTLLNLEHPRIKALQRLFKLGLSTLIFFGFFVNLYRSIVIRHAVSQGVDIAVTDVSTFTNRLAAENGRDRQSITVLWVYGTPSECYTLWYGNRHADFAFSDEISKLCPRDLELEIWRDLVGLPSGSMVPVDDVNWDVIVATEAALNDYPNLAEYGEPIYSQARLGTFGKIVYILPPRDKLKQ